jgi:tRNA(adenine34) deaminase
METDIPKNEHFMREALKEAQKAFDADEVPVGAVIVCNDKIIARAHNYTQRLNDVTAHAEMQAYTSASEHLGGKYLKECTLYVTLEPCIMCAGASYWTQIGKIIYGTKDPARGFEKVDYPVLHPKTIIYGGILAEECKNLLHTFFQLKRAKR